MAKEYFDQKIGPKTDWGGDASTGHKQVKGNRVQEYIKGEIADLHDADKKINSLFAGFVDNVTLKNTDAGSDYVKVVYDITRHMFFAVTMDGTTEKYHRLFDDFDIYNDGEFPNATPYSGKIYIFGTSTYVWDGEALVSTTKEASEESVRDIVRNYTPEEPEQES